MKIMNGKFDRELDFILFKRFQKLAEAFTDMSLVINLRPDAKYYGERASILLKLEKIDLAFDDMKIALQIEPSNHHIFYQRALVHRSLNDFKSALRGTSNLLFSFKRL